MERSGEPREEKRKSANERGMDVGKQWWDNGQIDTALYRTAERWTA